GITGTIAITIRMLNIPTSCDVVHEVVSGGMIYSKLSETAPAHATQLQVQGVLVAGVVHHPVPSRLLIDDYTRPSIGVHHVVGDQHPGGVLAAVAPVHDDAVAVRVVGGTVVLPGYDVVCEYVMEARVRVVEVRGD